MAKDSKTSAEMINDGFEAVATRSTWMIGVLVLLILGSISFISIDFGAELEANILFQVIWYTVAILCGFHIMLLLAYIYPLVVPLLSDFTDEADIERLEKLIKNFKTLIFLFIVSIPSSFVFGFGTWAFIN